MASRSARSAVVLVVAALLVAGCGDSDDGDSDGSGAAGTTTAESTTASSTTAAAGPDPAVVAAFDADGDGQITIGVAAAGPRDDGGYYQAVVAAAEDISAERGFADPIVIDDVQAADAATEMADLAEQGVDIIIVGASEIAEPLPDLTEQYPDIFWYCNCGAGFPELPGLAQSLDEPRPRRTRLSPGPRSSLRRSRMFGA